MADVLDVLIADGVIDEVLGRIKSGKEANISMVRRGELTLAAKVYKDRATRSFKNNAQYKEGRKVRNTRTQRAMDNGGQFGRDAAEQAWKSAEADALYRLADSGVRTPAPVMFYEGVLLLELVVDADGRPAPRLIEIALERDDVMGVYCDLVSQLISMLCCDLIHGDLSPYNILVAADGPTIIDFPQVISAAHNSRAQFYFLRDFDNVLAHLVGFDPSLAVHRADGRAIWQAYVGRELTPQFVPPPPRLVAPPVERSRPRNDRPFQQRSDRRGGPPPQQRSDRRPPQQRSDSRPPPQQRFDERPPQPQRFDARPPQQRFDSRPPPQQRFDARPSQPQRFDARPSQPQARQWSDRAQARGESASRPEPGTSPAPRSDVRAPSPGAAPSNGRRRRRRRYG